MSWKSLVSLVFTLIMGNVCLQKSVRMDSFWNVTYSADVQHTLIANRAQLPYSWKYEEKREECAEETPEESFVEGKILGYGSCVVSRAPFYHKFLFLPIQPGNGTLSILVAGNSWAMNFRNPIRAQFNYNYSSFRYCSVSGTPFCLLVRFYKLLFKLATVSLLKTSGIPKKTLKLWSN